MAGYPITRGFAETAGGQLHYRQAGAGKLVLLLQLLPFSTAMFEPLMPILAGLGYRCVALDLMGYGQSDARPSMWTVEEHADALAQAVLGLCGQVECVVSGHFTAMVATEFALRFSAGLHRLVLDGVPLWPRSVAQQRLQTMARPKLWDAEGTDVQALWTSAYGLLKKFDPELQLTDRNLPRVAEAFFGFTRTVLAPGSTEAIFRYALSERLTQLSVPTLVVGSPTDSLRDRHEAALALIPGAKGHLFEQTHPLYGFAEEPRVAEYASLLDNFIRS